MASLRLPVWCYVVSIAIAAAIGGEVWGLRTHTLDADGRWQSAKLDLARPVMGAVGFVATPVALAGNELDLGAWHGFQQVEWHEAVDATHFSFDFELAPGAHLTVLYGGNEGGWAGLRLSRDPSLASRHFLTTPEGRVVQAQPFAAEIGPGRHHAEFELGETTRVQIDGQALPPALGVVAGPRRLGFRGSARSTRIDDVRIRLRGGATVHEDFRNPGGLQRALVVGLALLAAIEAAVRLTRQRRGRARWLRLGLATTAATIAGLGWLAQTLLLGPLYPDRVPEESYPNRIETRDQAIARLGALDDPRPAILALGGSQTWGAGAGSPDHVWNERIEQALGGRYRIWNAGISGTDAQTLVTLYRDLWAPTRPRLLIAVFGVNDDEPAALERSLEELARIGRRLGIPTLLVQEPVAPEALRLPAFEANRERMATAAARHEWALFDMHEALARRRDEGLLWWDFVHLSSHGHALFAEMLLPAVRRSLGEGGEP